MPIGQGCLVEPHLFDRAVRTLLPKINREPIKFNTDD